MILARIFLLLRIFFSQGTLKKPKKGLQSVTCLQTKKCDRIGLQSAAGITKSNGIPSWDVPVFDARNIFLPALNIPILC